MNGPYAYLIHLLGWTVPILVAQLGFLYWHHRANTLRVLGAILPPALISTVWLVSADHLAISQGIWRFGEDRHLGIYLAKVPLEEVLFFLITNLLVAFGLALFVALFQRRAMQRVQT